MPCTMKGLQFTELSWIPCWQHYMLPSSTATIAAVHYPANAHFVGSLSNTQLSSKAMAKLNASPGATALPTLDNSTAPSKPELIMDCSALSAGRCTCTAAGLHKQTALAYSADRSASALLLLQLQDACRCVRCSLAAGMVCLIMLLLMIDSRCADTVSASAPVCVAALKQHWQVAAQCWVPVRQQRCQQQRQKALQAARAAIAWLVARQMWRDLAPADTADCLQLT
jgi:hypothetical protein